MKNTIAKNLRRLRAGLRQKQVAAALGINPEAYKKYEQGKAWIPVWVLIRIKKFYNLQSLDEILRTPAVN